LFARIVPNCSTKRFVWPPTMRSTKSANLSPAIRPSYPSPNSVLINAKSASISALARFQAQLFISDIVCVHDASRHPQAAPRVMLILVAAHRLSPLIWLQIDAAGVTAEGRADLLGQLSVVCTVLTRWRLCRWTTFVSRQTLHLRCILVPTGWVFLLGGRARTHCSLSGGRTVLVPGIARYSSAGILCAGICNVRVVRLRQRRLSCHGQREKDCAKNLPHFANLNFNSTPLRTSRPSLVFRRRRNLTSGTKQPTIA
jgi:hypothetical protein